LRQTPLAFGQYRIVPPARGALFGEDRAIGDDRLRQLVDGNIELLGDRPQRRRI
jgi:hypothetical protein